MLLAAVVAICAVPGAAHADVFGVNDREFYIGVAKQATSMTADNGNIRTGPRHNLSGSGIALYGVGTQNGYLSGTALPGTVSGDIYILWVQDDANRPVGGFLDIFAGPQTIVCPDQTVPPGTAVTLAPHSVDGNGSIINVAAMNPAYFTNQALIDAHQPTYTFGGGDPAIATIDGATGAVTVVGLGATTFTINSAATGSYQVAQPLVVNFTVAARAPASAIPKTGDGFPLEGLLLAFAILSLTGALLLKAPKATKKRG